MSIEVLSPARREDAAGLLARAFWDDPGYVYTFPDEARRAVQLGWLYPRIVRANGRFGATFTLGGEGEGEPLLAVSSWMPPGKTVGTLDMAREGMLLSPFVLGLRETKRMLSTLSTLEDERHRCTEHRPHWFLDQLAVEPEHQGRGHGRRALAAAMDRCRAEADLPMFLFTSKERNVPFYEGSGFAVVKEQRLGGEGGFRLWAMLKTP